MRIFRPSDAPSWLGQVLASVEQLFRDIMPAPFRLVSYTVAELPTAANYTGGLIYVSDETGGATIAFSDGTDWRRVQDRAVVS